MQTKKRVRQPAIMSLKSLASPDRGELISLIEPMKIAADSPQREALTDLALELATRSAGFQRSLPPSIVNALASLIRITNCHYSNLIEGHNTHPVDIERALNNDYSSDVKKRDLQREAKAHIEVQSWIDQGQIKGKETQLTSLCEIHRRFCKQLPGTLLQTTDPQTGESSFVIPGQLRQRDVIVGRHLPISAGALPRFLQRFEQVYGNLSKTESIISAAAAHHRLAWIHPFLDGNGRVARLMSHAMLSTALDTGGLWSITRGLARNASNYKSHLAACDLTRRNDLDGRGNLSEEALVAFTQFFLESCLDQVKFMEALMQPERLRSRILLWTEEEIRAGQLPATASKILEAILYRGELARGEIPGLLDMSERHARRTISALMEKNILASESSRAPLGLVFSAKLAARWLPGLFPEI